MVKVIKKQIEEIIEDSDMPMPENQVASLDKILRHKKILLASGAVILIALGLFLVKGLLIAATVNGSPISRLSVVEELEKRSGKQALESLIQKKLIETELNKKGITVNKEEVDDKIKKIEAQVESQGGTLKDALSRQGMTEEQFRDQVTIQKKIEKLLADKIQVSQEEIDAYIKNNKIAPPKGIKIEDFKKQLDGQLKQQKLQQEAQKWISDLTTSAQIKYYVNY